MSSKSKSATQSSAPSYASLVHDAISKFSQGRRGASRQAIRKFVEYTHPSFKLHLLRAALNRGIASGQLSQTGQSFRVKSKKSRSIVVGASKVAAAKKKKASTASSKTASSKKTAKATQGSKKASKPATKGKGKTSTKTQRASNKSNKSKAKEKKSKAADDSKKHADCCVKEITTDVALEQVLKDAGDKVVVIDFFATWCGPCKLLEPALNKLALKEVKHAIFVKVDVDKVPALAKEFGIEAMPTVVFMKNQDTRGGVEGATIGQVKSYLKAAKQH